MQWIVITGGGSGIGRILDILTCGRRHENLENTKSQSTCPENVTIVEADISKSDDRERFVSKLPNNAQIYLLIQNAAVGDPAELSDVDPKHLEYAFQVNVVAPMALVQLFRRNLEANGQQKGRVLHLGTSVAHRPQPGTLTYGVTKMAFHRLYEQLNLEGVVCGSLSPFLVDAEVLRDHVAKARSFDRAFENDWTTPVEKLVDFILELMQMDDVTFSSKEWHYSEWRTRCS